ncbi:MAG: hypothetical protein ACREBC_32600, partial [Pyrinomonadaceae bacterium]
MKKAAAVTFLLALFLGVTAFVIYHYSSSVFRDPATLPQPPTESLEASVPAQEPFSTPPPPPSLPYETGAQSPAEPQRVLIGVKSEQLSLMEKYLPEGAQVVTYAISETQMKAALANADLDGDGNLKTVVVYNLPESKNERDGSQLLYLAVLEAEGDRMIMRATTHLYGSYIQNNIFDTHAVPFSVQDVTGDNHPEIIVTSAIGASLGSELQVFSFKGASLHKIAEVFGNILHVEVRGAGKPGVIIARSRYS